MRAIDVPAGSAADLADLLDLIEDMRSGWRKDAACKNPDVDPSWFTAAASNVSRAARAVCMGCPVVAECARFGADQEAGVWAGEFPNQLAEWRDRKTSEWAQLMAGRVRVTTRMKTTSRKQKNNDAAA